MSEFLKSARDRAGLSAREVNDRIDLRAIARILWGGKWWIIGCVIVATLLGIYYLLTTPNTYRADTLLQIQSDSTSPLSGLSGNSEASVLSGQQNSAAQSQIPIIKSRDVLGETVRSLDLAIHADQQKPFLGGLFSSNNSSVAVTRFDVPDRLRGVTFKLVLESDKRYELLTEAGQPILSGVVGKAATGKMPMGGEISIFIREAYLAKNQPVTFELTKREWLSQVNSLYSSLKVTEASKGSGIVTLAMEGTNRTFITRVLNSIAQNYVEQNVEARSKNAQKSLEFLDRQLPELKSDVDAAEARLASYKEKNQPVDLSSESAALLQRAASVDDKKSQLQLKIAELKQQYTEEYPAVRAAREQLQELSRQDRQVQSKINQLPSSQKRMLGLQRDLKVNTQLYTSLMNRAQELRVVKAGTVGNVRIIDPAVRPVKPVWPNAKLVMFLYIVVGILIGVAIVVLRSAMRSEMVDAAEIEGKTGYAVYSVIPASLWMRRASRKRRKGDREPLLARDRPGDVVVEAMRSLRTSLHFAQMETQSNVAMITGPSPGVGKSFLSMNIGHLLANAEQSVVVVDADMRRGRIHRFLSEPNREPGLSEVLSGSHSIDDVLRTVEGSELVAVSAGRIPPNPSELLLRERFRETIEELSSRFDLVIVDAPPVLAVTDAGVIASALGHLMTFMVLRSGTHPAQEIDEAISRFERQGGKITGLLLNQYSPKQASAAKGYGHYQYAYAADTN